MKRRWRPSAYSKTDPKARELTESEALRVINKLNPGKREADRKWLEGLERRGWLVLEPRFKFPDLVVATFIRDMMTEKRRMHSRHWAGSLSVMRKSADKAFNNYTFIMFTDSNPVFFNAQTTGPAVGAQYDFAWCYNFGLHCSRVEATIEKLRIGEPSDEYMENFMAEVE